MAKRDLHHRALEMRKKGMSYSQIKSELGVSKSTLSTWLHEYPLSHERIQELRGKNEQRIERYRETRAKTKRARLASVKDSVSKKLFPLSARDLYIGGLFLYWGEGSKSTIGSTAISNTDPSVLIFFIKWLEYVGIAKAKLRIKLHLYADMDIEKEISFWKTTLQIPASSFRKPYIKKSTREGITYFQRFTHGTCNVIYENRDTYEHITQALVLLREQFADADTI